MKTAFVTGGTGFLGFNLVKQLLEDDWQVIALHRSSSDLSDLKQLNVRLVEGDLRDPGSLAKIIPTGVDPVFHVAGNTNMWSLRDKEQTRDNVDGTRNMVDVALAKKAGRFIHTSSTVAFGWQERVLEETLVSTAPESRINYFRSKWQAEQEVRKGIARALDAVILNPANILGPYDYKSWSRLFVLISDGKLPGMPPGTGSWCHVSDVARAHIRAYEVGRTGQNYLLGGVDASFLEVAQRIAKLVHRRVPRRPLPRRLLMVLSYLSLWGSYVTHSEPDITPEKVRLLSGDLRCRSDKAVSDLSYRSASLDEMIGDSYRWLVSTGRLG